jgi:hypothetical protein
MDMNTRVITFCDEYDSNILLAEGFEEAFLGVGGQFNDNPVAMYDKNKCIDLLTKEFKRNTGTTVGYEEETDFYEQALEYFDFNVKGSYVGEKTPIFIDRFYQ